MGTKRDSVYVWIDDTDGEAYSPLSFTIIIIRLILLELYMRQ